MRGSCKGRTLISFYEHRKTLLFINFKSLSFSQVTVKRLLGKKEFKGKVEILIVYKMYYKPKTNLAFFKRLTGENIKFKVYQFFYFNVSVLPTFWV